MLAIHADNEQVFITSPKHSKIALNTEQQINCCNDELYLKKAGGHCIEFLWWMKIRICITDKMLFNSG